MFLQVKNLKKSYGTTQVLRGMSFELEKSQDLAIVGSSGCGKSTLLYILGALETPESGQIIINNVDISTLNDEELAKFRNESIGFVFQFHFLLPSMNCLDNALLPAKIGGHKTKDVKKRVLNFAKILQVEHCLKKYPFEISGGEQQRINIIRAISLNPKLILCDEPTGNLDSKNTSTVLELLRSLSEEIDSTLVVVTHDENVANSFHKKITIEDGQIIS
jgi:ABC-type lipoprotein export system ATPase subunit